MNACTPQTIEFIKSNILADVHELRLRSKYLPNVDIDFALLQIAYRQRIKNKLPAWYINYDIVFPSKISLEQCSSEYTAKYKAKLAKGDVLIDMTGGLGIDTYYLSAGFKQVYYVEQNEILCETAKNNFKALGANNIQVINENSVDFLLHTPKTDCIYIDPARRDEVNKKQVLLEDCTPNLIEIKDLLFEKANQVIIKLSPLFDMSELERNFYDKIEYHIIAVRNECKEVLLNIKRDNITSSYVCSNILSDGGIQQFEFGRDEEIQTISEFTSQPETYIYEPNVSILKAGAFRLIGARYSLKKFHQHSHLYTSNKWIANFQGRSFKFIKMFSLQKNDIKELQTITNKANITVRNFPLSVDELRKKIKMKEGGEYYIFATTLANNQKVLLLTIRNIDN